jgi:hypothetical protein
LYMRKLFVRIVMASAVLSPAQGFAQSTAIAASAKPTVIVGLDEPDPQQAFGMVVSAVRLENGVIVVADAQARQLRVFDRTGRFVRVIGRKGGGPGEFQWLAWVRARRDTIQAYDPVAKRVSKFNVNGRLLSESHLRISSITRPTVLGPFKDGSYIAADAGANGPAGREAAAGARKYTFTFYRLGSTENEAKKLFEVSGADLFRIIDASDGPPLSFDSKPAFGRDIHFSSSEDRIYAALNDSYVIPIYDVQGRRTGEISKKAVPRTVTAEEVRKYTAAVVATSSKPMFAQYSKEALAKAGAAKTFPAFGAIKVDRVQRVWVGEYALPGQQPRTWTVFGKNGELIANAVLPAGVEVLDIGEDYVLGKMHDDLDVEYVAMYRLNRSH